MKERNDSEHPTHSVFQYDCNEIEGNWYEEGGGDLVEEMEIASIYVDNGGFFLLEKEHAEFYMQDPRFKSWGNGGPFLLIQDHWIVEEYLDKMANQY